MSQTRGTYNARLTYHALNRRTVVEIQENIVEKGGRNLVSRLIYAKSDKDTIAAWKLDLNRILHVFNVRSIIFTRLSLTFPSQTELAMNTHVTVSDVHHDVSGIRHNMSKIQEEISGQARSVGATFYPTTDAYHPQTQAILDTMQSTVSLSHSVPPGELPPPPPRACFGRDELIEKIIDLAENLTPIALIGPGGIGKTSVALAVLHHDRTKKRFGNDRWFIRCDQFPSSRTHFLSRLSKVIGAGVENPEDLTPLRSFLSSTKMIIVLDNAESILDPQGTNAPEIYALVEELSQFDNVCLCITSRISTIPSDCETLDVPTLPTDAARDAFYRIYKGGERSNLVNCILEQLDFHPLSITLLATVAHHNRWDANRLAGEWDRRRIDVLRTQHNRSLAATIELSLASPMFQELGPDARGLLGAVAFFPQGVDENNLEWLFPAISDRAKAFDNFCILSLTYRSNGFVTMLAPLRDYLYPKDPRSSPVLCTTKERYFHRLSVDINPDTSGFEESRWIISEDVNVEHLLDVFTSTDTSSGDIWETCADFMEHMYWHKPRLVVLEPKIEGLPDSHRSKPICLFRLSRLLGSVGNHVGRKRLLDHTLKLWRERKSEARVAQTLRFMSGTNGLLGFRKEGIQQVKEALEISERLGDVSEQARSLERLASLLYDDKQLGAAEEAALRVIGILSDKRDQFPACKCYRLLGDICRSRGETEKAIKHYETALRIASPFDWRNRLFWTNYSLAELFFGENRFDDAHTHIERAKSHTINNSYPLGCAMRLQAELWYKERRLEEAKSEAIRAADVFRKLGAARDVEHCGGLLRDIGMEMET